MNYKLKLDIFEGPLDLLLYLIKKSDIDIGDIPISEVTDQYMQYIDMMQMLDLDIVGDFLVMAATLMQIKSKMLLPPDPNEEQEQEDDPRSDLARRLYEYQKFKQIADELKEKETLRKDLFPRNMDEEQMQKIKEDAKETYFEANLFDLISAFTEALKKVPEDIIHEIVKEEYTVEQKIHEILHLLLNYPEVSLRDLFEKAQRKMEIIVTFLAILELIRLKEIVVIQKQLFGDINILRNKDYIAPPPSSDESEEEDQDQESVDQTEQESA